MVFSTGSQARKGMYSSNMSASSYDRPRIWSSTRLTYEQLKYFCSAWYFTICVSQDC